MDEFWVFGYGSLMWNPGFPYEARLQARAFGYRRALCVRSFVHRGTPERPGLVLGLDRGGSCRGVAFQVAPRDWPEVVDYLRARELVTHVYLERHLPVALEDGRQVKALSYVVDRGHPQYAGALEVETAARIVHASTGKSGPNHAYVDNTLSHMQDMGIRDLWLEGVAEAVLRLRHQTVA
ncbi:gamma-glutamylcyclotransferase [Rhizobium sp. SSA_523]|uniref:gamma-glutamylcyclotransferase n=1 Tax=Rhizobium sp. SSA_523 TaxID=2952477 RepID=UPI00209109B7|nr:gamma-glutamylcyclotransferase [Rhizobium sp. SSA_523]MCO5733668.1 gamma-glutamylcyclotransferase [Rhizobium sp. SSA_523]WKC23038.1 gamma-glutamylcyclotransferase [Rhizobium sp. SSA_523]